MISDHLDPSGYPWAEPERAGVLHHDGFHEGDGSARGPGGRTPVVAVGSNAAPAVLVHKLGALLVTGLPMATATVDGLHVGHSAHVSARGYVAAAPARGTAARRVTVCWFDAAQLARLDATEPNYRRVPLPGSMPCLLVGVPGPSSRTVDGPLVRGAQVYESVHGVLGEGGTALGLRGQAEVLAWLAARVPPDLRNWLSHDRLTDADVRERVRLALIEADLAVPSGL